MEGQSRVKHLHEWEIEGGPDGGRSRSGDVDLTSERGHRQRLGAGERGAGAFMCPLWARTGIYHTNAPITVSHTPMCPPCISFLRPPCGLIWFVTQTIKKTMRPRRGKLLVDKGGMALTRVLVEQVQSSEATREPCDCCLYRHR